MIGVGGGLGRTLAEALVTDRWRVHAFSRSASEIADASCGSADVTDEASLQSAAASVDAPLATPATGYSR